MFTFEKSRTEYNIELSITANFVLILDFRLSNPFSTLLVMKHYNYVQLATLNRIYSLKLWVKVGYMSISGRMFLAITQPFLANFDKVVYF